MASAGRAPCRWSAPARGLERRLDDRVAQGGAEFADVPLRQHGGLAGRSDQHDPAAVGEHGDLQPTPGQVAAYDLATVGTRVQPALERLLIAVDYYGDGHERSRVLALLRAAVLHVLHLDPREAAALGRRALVDAEPLRSDRVRQLLRELHTAARPHRAADDVAELRREIGNKLARAS